MMPNAHSGLLDNLDAQHGRDVRIQADLHLGQAKRADRLRQLHQLAIDGDTLVRVGALDVLGRHRPVHLVLLANGAGDLDADRAQLLRRGLCLLAGRISPSASQAPELFHARQVASGGRQSERAGVKEVASVTGAHAHHVAALAEVVHLALQNYLNRSRHLRPLSSVTLVNSRAHADSSVSSPPSSASSGSVSSATARKSSRTSSRPKVLASESSGSASSSTSRCSNSISCGTGAAVTASSLSLTVWNLSTASWMRRLRSSSATRTPSPTYLRYTYTPRPCF